MYDRNHVALISLHEHKLNSIQAIYHAGVSTITIDIAFLYKADCCLHKELISNWKMLLENLPLASCPSYDLL